MKRVLANLLPRIELLRPQQWVKNAFVPIVASSAEVTIAGSRQA